MEFNKVMSLVQNGIQSVLPTSLLSNCLSLNDGVLRFSEVSSNDHWVLESSLFEKVLVVGAGKGTADMVVQLLGVLDEGGYQGRVEGVVNVPDYLEGYGESVVRRDGLYCVEFCYASHPIPNEIGMEGAKRQIELIQRQEEMCLVVALMSGGGSSLFPQPVEGISLDELQIMNEVLISSGADITDINCMRKHVSQVKGGMLARIIRRKNFYCASLIISDVIGDDKSVIASGPTCPDEQTFERCFEICEKYNVMDQMPESVVSYLSNGAEQLVEETPKSSSDIFDPKYLNNFIIGNVGVASRVIAEELCHSVPFTKIFSNTLSGEASTFGTNLFRVIDSEIPKNISSAVLIGTGEFTVTLKGKGIGGRNQEMLASALLELSNPSFPETKYIASKYSFTIISFAFDGIEGNSEAAGAYITNKSLSQCISQSINIQNILDANNSNALFKAIGTEIITGPTGTNTNDMTIIILNPLPSKPEHLPS